MKKIVSSFLIIMLFLVTSIGINANTQSNDISASTLFDKCIKKGNDFLYDYYHKINMKEDIDASKHINDIKLLQYIELKHTIMKNRLVRQNIEVSHSSIDVSYYNHNISDNKIEIIYNVLIKRQYKGCDEVAESMRQVKLEFANVNGFVNITDYFEFTHFDLNVLSIQKNYDSQNSLSINPRNKSTYNFEFNDNLIEILEHISTKETEFFDRLESTSHIKTSEIERTSVSSTARQNMVSYALNNCSRNNPDSGNILYAPYYDFSDISGAYDCTNFTSHCLLAGGTSESPNWYFNSLSSRTPSWSGVNQFYEFIVNNTGIGPQAEERTLAYSCPYSYTNWKTGDIIQIKYSGYGYPDYGHNTIITGSYSPSTYSYTPRITSRTSKNSYNRNEILTVEYPIGSWVLDYRLLYLTSL